MNVDLMKLYCLEPAFFRMLYRFFDTHDEIYLYWIYDLMNGFTINQLRRYIRYYDLDPYDMFWYKRKHVIIHSIIIRQMQNMIDPDSHLVIKWVLDLPEDFIYRK